MSADIISSSDLAWVKARRQKWRMRKYLRVAQTDWRYPNGRTA